LLSIKQEKSILFFVVVYLEEGRMRRGGHVLNGPGPTITTNLFIPPKKRGEKINQIILWHSSIITVIYLNEKG